MTSFSLRINVSCAAARLSLITPLIFFVILLMDLWDGLIISFPLSDAVTIKSSAVVGNSRPFSIYAGTTASGIRTGGRNNGGQDIIRVPEVQKPRGCEGIRVQRTQQEGFSAMDIRR